MPSAPGLVVGSIDQDERYESELPETNTKLGSDTMFPTLRKSVTI